MAFTILNLVAFKNRCLNRRSILKNLIAAFSGITLFIILTIYAAKSVLDSPPISGLPFLLVLLGLATSILLEAIIGWYLSLLIYTFIETLIMPASGSPVVQPAAATVIVPSVDPEPAESLPEDARADSRLVELTTSDVRIKVNVQEWNQNNH
jgi:hypothetical protein